MTDINEIDHKLKILYLPRWYPNRYDPMPGLFIERHGRAASAFVEISVLYVHPDPKLRNGKFEVAVSSDEEIREVRVYYPAASGGFGRIRAAWNFIKAHRIGFREIKKISGKPDIIHVHVLTRLGILAWFYKICTGTPYVITEHWTRYLQNARQFNGSLRKLMTRIVVRNASAVLPVTQNLADAMISHGLNNSNYHVIPNVVDVVKFVPAEKERSGKIKMVHVSCFEDRQKNISGLLNALKRLSEIRQDWEIHMVGEGVHFDDLVEMAQGLGLHGVHGDFVVFHGLKEGEELVKLMQDADFHVLFSRFENLPVVILESYACGVPVLSTDVGGIRERMNDGLGMLIESENEDMLLENLIEMMERRLEFSREAIRKYAVDTFSKEVIGESLYKVYKNTISPQ